MGARAVELFPATTRNLVDIGGEETDGGGEK